MKFCGYNGFGQFGQEHGRCEKRFTDFCPVPAECSYDWKSIQISPSWSYLALSDGGTNLWLNGFLSNKPNAQLQLKCETTIRAISANDRFCLVLLNNGKLFKVKPLLSATLEEIQLENCSTGHLTQKRSIFGELKSQTKFLVTHIASGNNITAAFSNLNEVYSVPSRIFVFAKHFRLKQLVCGFEHALLLSANGDVYSWGNGLRGQLGQDVIKIEETPIVLQALEGIKITEIAAGGWHSAAISAFGDLYVWGYNPNGQLAIKVFKANSMKLKEPTVYPLPQLIDLPKCGCQAKLGDSEANKHGNTFASDECEPCKVFAGARHTFVLRSCGALLAAGWNFYGQLGCEPSKEYIDSFTEVEFNREINCQLVCGAWNTILLCDRKENS